MRNRRTKSARLGQKPTLKIVFTLLLLFIVLFTLLSLFSYNLGNVWFGRVGAASARFLLHRIGFGAYLLPVMILLIMLNKSIQWPKKNWIIGLFLLGLALLFILSFDSYLIGVSNYFGSLGNILSERLINFLGIGSYCLPVLLVIWGRLVIRRGELKGGLKDSAILILFTLFIETILAFLGFSPLISGSLGGFIDQRLSLLIGRVGEFFLLLFILFGALLTITKIRDWVKKRLLALGEKVGYWAQAIAVGIKRNISSLKKGTGEPIPVPKVEPPRSDSWEVIPTIATRPKRPATFPKEEFKANFLQCLATPSSEEEYIKDSDEARREAERLLEKLKEFEITGKITDILTGPMITRFEFQPAPGIKIQRIENLADDLALSLRAERIRILAPIPGKSAVGIEIPNKERRTVFLKKILTSDAYLGLESPLTFALGETITGEPYCADLRLMPHILIAGTTGSGKSVCINTIISSIIYRSTFRDVRLLTIDPKQLELPIYNPIPHLISPTTIHPREALDELDQVIRIMEERYGEFARAGVRDIEGYNQNMLSAERPKKPYIVVIIDELADLMLRAPTEIEDKITRLAQMSRAVGIHLILATQRPSVDVITGLIKANFPCRIAFQVASKTDSRTILDMNGAEALLGRGDMLFLPPGKGEPVRLHCAYISAEETKKVVELISTYYLTELLAEIVDDPQEKAAAIIRKGAIELLIDKEKAAIKEKRATLNNIVGEKAAEELLSLDYYSQLPEIEGAQISKKPKDELRELDEFFAESARLVFRHKEASVSMLQRRLDVGWARAGRIIDQLEQAGIVGPYVGSKSRRVLVESEEELERIIAQVLSKK